MADAATYRDSLANVDKESGKRNWIYPKKPSGTFHRLRVVVSILLLTLLFSGPFIQINGRPLMLFNVLERKFIIFGQVFWPQDFYLFVLAMLSFIVFIVLFTVVFGRVFCGWACPQTIFMEMVFRKIEYWIEGDYTKQKKLDAQPWNTEKIVKKTSKHLVFFLVSFIIANTFLAYLIGVDDLKLLVTQSPLEHLGTFSALVAFTFAFYWVFAKLRELVCIMACPYGRLQGVMLDNDSVVVAYDHVRGEPRGKLRKKEERTIGDCIDCKQCVYVCPTGIDIRNGTQLECVNCTACIDACDEIMVKINKPKGLIRFASINNIIKKQKLRFSPRIAAYSTVLVLLIGLFSFFLFTRSDIDATILRAPGMLYEKQDDETIRNFYNLELVNKTLDEVTVHLKLKMPEGEVTMAAGDMVVAKEEVAKSIFFIDLPRDLITERSTDLAVQVYAGDQLIDELETSFLGPVTRKKF